VPFLLRGAFQFLKFHFFMKNFPTIRGGQLHIAPLNMCFLQKNLAMLLFSAFLLFSDTIRGQAGGPAAQWNTSVNFYANVPLTEDSWAFDGVQVADGRFVVGGYVEMNPHTNASVKTDHSEDGRRPEYTILDTDGNMLMSKYFGDKAVDLNDLTQRKGRIAKIKRLECPTDPAQNGVLLLGYQATKANNGQNQVFVVWLDNHLNEIWTSRFNPQQLANLSGNESIGSGLDAVWNTTTNKFDVTISGDCVVAGAGVTYAGTFNFSTTGAAQLVAGTFSTSPRGTINDCKSTGSDVYFIGKQYISTQMISPTGNNSEGVPPPISSFDEYKIMIGRKTNTGTPTIRTFVESNFIHGNCNAAGPCTPQKSIDAWNYCGSGSAAVDNMGANARSDVGESILRIGNFVYALVSVRQLDLTSNFFPGWQFNGNGVLLKGACLNGTDFHYSDYKDAEMYLMKFNADLSDAAGTQILYVGHFSGGDFHGALLEDKVNGGLVIGGTTADKGICVSGGLPDVDLAGGVAEANYLIKVNPDLMTVTWQQHFAGQGLGNCTFGMVQTNDGGFAIIGNNDLDDGVDDTGETFNIVKYGADDGCKMPPDCTPNTYISGNIVWNAQNQQTPKHVSGILTVAKNATLTIDGVTIGFGYGKSMLNTKTPKISGIVVEGGGTLIIKNGAILRGTVNTCGHASMWDGISAKTDGTSQNSSVNISSNAQILDAARGIVSGELNYQMVKTYSAPASGGIQMHPQIQDSGKGGASITSSNATFTNCGKNIVWNAPVFSGVKTAKISNTVFECTSALIDPTYRNTFGIGSPLGTEVNCEAKSMRNISFTDCVFKNTAGFPAFNNNGVGIYGFQTRFYFTGDGIKTNFKNLFIGAEAASGPAGVTNHVTAKNLIFYGCLQGLNLRSTTGSTVINCKFRNIPLFVNPAEFPSGLYSEASQSISIVQNYFQSGSSGLQGGAVVTNSNSGADIYKNTFDNIGGTASAFVWDNLNLQARCNEYEELNTVSAPQNGWFVIGKLADQGTGAGLNDKQPDNFFWSNCTQLNVFDINNWGQSFIYYEKSTLPSASSGVVQCVSNVVIDNFSAIPNNNLPNCPVQNPCLGEACNGLLADYQNNGNALPTRNELLRAYLGTDPASSVNASESSLNSSVSLLVQRNQQTDRQLLAESYIGLGDYTNAAVRAAQIIGTDAATQHLQTALNTAIAAGNAGRTVYNLNNTEWNNISTLLNTNELAGAWAQNIDFARNHVYHPLFLTIPTQPRTPEDVAKAIKEPSVVKAFPNPFSETVEFTAGNLEIKEIVVYNVMGKQIWSKIDQTADWFWQPNRSIPNGIYRYTVRIANGATLYGSVVLIRD
jgi:hypothetical protein